MFDGYHSASVGVGLGKICASMYCTVPSIEAECALLRGTSVAIPINKVVVETCGCTEVSSVCDACGTTAGIPYGTVYCSSC